MAAICLVKKSNLLRGFFRSLIFLTWCISISSVLPQITQGAFNLDLVNLAFHTFSKFFNGSWVMFTALAIFVAVLYLISINDILLSSLTFTPKSFPNFLKTAARVDNLNFLARVNPQDSFISHPIQATSTLLLTKL